jgi:hypothetical protein
MAGPVDPDRIDISLDIVGEGSLAAIEQLAEQMSRVTEHLSQFERGTAGSAQVQSSMGARFRQGTGVNEGGPSRGASIAASAPLPDAHGLGGSYPEQSTWQRLRQWRNPTQAVESEVRYYGQRERAQHARRRNQGMPDFDLSGVGGSGGGYGYNFGNEYLGSYVDGGNYTGGVSAGASISGPMNAPDWRRALTANPSAWEQAQEGIRLPPGGLSMNIQDKLRLASNAFAGSAERSLQRRMGTDYATGLQEALGMGWTQEQFNQGINDMDYSGEGLRRGNTATLLRSASESNLLVGLQAVGHDVSRLGGRAYAFGGGLQQAGVAAGYGRAGQINIPGTNIGITNPLDFFRQGSALREGINQRVNVQRLRMMGGINREQANAIVGSLAGAGWTGEEGQGLAFDAIAPLVQQGLDPGATTAMMDQAIRNGNTSVQDFVDTMKDLGPAAHAARMSLTEYQEALNGFAEWAKGAGATYGQGLSLGRNVSESLGMAPQVAQSLMESPMVQAGGIAQGLLPNELGLMNGPMAQQSIFNALNMAENATSNFPSIKDAHGNIVVSGRDRQDAQIATIMGTTPEIVKSLRRQSQSSPAASRALTSLDHYGSTAKAVRQRTPMTSKRVPRVGEFAEVGEFEGQNALLSGSHDVKKVDGKYYMKVGKDDPAIAYGMKAEILNPIDTAMHGASGDSWNAVAKNLRSFEHTALHTDKNRAEFDKQMHAISQMDDPQKRVAAAHKLVDDTMRKVRGPQQDDRPKVYVEFTGKAKQFFKQSGQDARGSAKDDASRGGTPINDYVTSVQAPRLSGNDLFGP